MSNTEDIHSNSQWSSICSQLWLRALESNTDKCGKLKLFDSRPIERWSLCLLTWIRLGSLAAVKQCCASLGTQASGSFHSPPGNSASAELPCPCAITLRHLCWRSHTCPSKWQSQLSCPAKMPRHQSHKRSCLGPSRWAPPPAWWVPRGADCCPNGCCFKPLSFGVTCSTGVDNWSTRVQGPPLPLVTRCLIFIYYFSKPVSHLSLGLGFVPACRVSVRIKCGDSSKGLGPVPTIWSVFRNAITVIIPFPDFVSRVRMKGQEEESPQTCAFEGMGPGQLSIFPNE